MKKLLLLTISLAAVLALNAQRYQFNSSITPEAQPERNIEESLITSSPVIPLIPEKPVVEAGDRNLVTIITIGTAGNAYGLYNGGRSALWADNNLNSVAFSHRQRQPSSGHLGYDLSTDGGWTWNNNILVYDPALGGANARYPQGVIYNPVGNTNPMNAFYSYFAATLDGSNTGGASWGGYAGGVHKLDQTTSPTQNDWSSQGAFRQNVPSAMHINPANGDVWVFECALIDGLGNQYTDSLLITKGTFNSATNDYEYTRWLKHAPTYTPGRAAADEKIAFAPNGQIGYMSLLWDNGGDPFAAGIAFYPVIYKTTDGGQTWSDPVAIVLGGPDGFDEVKYYLTDAQWEDLWVPPAPHRDSVPYTTAFDHDMVVDMNGNLHISVTIGVASVTTPYAIIASGGFGATFHIYSLNQGACFAAQYVTHNKTFRGELGEISEDSRSQISITQDGSKVFLSWLDTDFEGVDDNIMPDIHAWAFDVNTRMYTDVYNVTYLSEGWLEAYQGTASYYVFSNESGYVVPFVYQTIPGGDPLNPVDFKYIYDFTLTDADFSFGPHEPPSCGTPGDANGDGVVNVLDIVTTISYILGNSPQPFVFENADVNGDGVINVLDVVAIVNIILGGKGEAGVKSVNLDSSNIMKVLDAEGMPGENIIIEIEVINDDVFVAFQFDLPIPEGFGYVANSIALTDRKANHQVQANVLPGTNIFRAIAFSLTNAAFSGNSGVVTYFTFTTPDVAGQYPLAMTEAILSDIQAQDILTGTEGGVVTLSEPATARLQVIHNSADAAAVEVDVWLNDVKLLEDFAFRTATEFIDAPAGVEFTVAIQPPGSTSPENPLWSQNYTLEADETYILIANGIVVETGYDPIQPFNVYVFPQGKEAADDPGKTDLLVFHGSTDAPTVSVWETGVGAGELFIFEYGEFAGYLELATLDYTIEIRDETGQVAVAIYDAPLETLNLQGAALTVVASGFLNPEVNSDGPVFGLWVATPLGGDLIQLPGGFVGINELKPVSSQFSITQNYPNPAKGQTQFTINLEQLSMVNIEIVNIMGQKVYTNNLGNVETGSHPVTIDMSGFATGIYFCTVKADEQKQTLKLLVE